MKALPWVLALVAVLALAASVTFAGWAGDARAESARLRAALDSLATQTARVDTAYVRDTTVLWRVQRSTDTLTATVEQWKHDTVRVVEYVERADSTIRACSAVVLTCEARVAVRDSTIGTLRSLNANTESRLRAETARGRRDRLVFGALGALAGWALKP